MAISSHSRLNWSLRDAAEVTPTGIAIAAGAAAMIVAALIAGAIPTSQPGWRFAVMAIAVGLFAAVSLDQRALLVITIIAFGISNGFLEDRFGQLTWHGSEDLRRILLLIMAAGWGLAVGEAYRYVRNLRARWTVPQRGTTEEEKHGA